ncbi:MAG: SGNH hydrolase domain-containing protein, partial [Luteibacter sp.]
DWYPSRGQALRSPDGCAVARTYTRTPHGWHGTFERSGCDSVRSGPSVFVVGDSHALAYGPMFARYTMDTGSQVTVYNNGGCPMLSLQPQREASEHCRASASMVLADVLGRLRRGDVVFLPSLRLPRYVDQGVMQADDAVASMVSGREATDARTAAIAPGIDLVRRLTRAGAQVVIQAPNLILRAPPYRCADWWTAGNPICARGTAIDRAMFESLRAPVLAALAEIVDADESVTLFDPLPSLCPSGEVCSGFRNGRPLFFDGDHLSAYGNHAVYPAFLAAMRAQARAMSMPAPTTSPMGACAQRMAPAKAPGGCSGVDVLPERQPMSPAV